MKFAIGVTRVRAWHYRRARSDAAECVDSPGKVLRVCVGAEGGRAFYEVEPARAAGAEALGARACVRR